MGVSSFVSVLIFLNVFLGYSGARHLIVLGRNLGHADSVFRHATDIHVDLMPWLHVLNDGLQHVACDILLAFLPRPAVLAEPSDEYLV
jgi:hypothetical protein